MRWGEGRGKKRREKGKDENDGGGGGWLEGKGWQEEERVVQVVPVCGPHWRGWISTGVFWRTP